MPALRAVSTISACRARPASLPSSAKPLAPRIIARTPAFAPEQTTAGVAAAGITVNAQSIGCGTSSSER